MKPDTSAGAGRRRGRPPGTTAQGVAMRRRLYGTAIDLIARQGYDSTTLRDIAARAGVSPALLYKYFPSKRAVVLALYDELSAEYAERAERLQPGRWRDRFLFALKTSLGVLEPNRETISALVPVLIGDRHEGVFSENAAFSRLRVQGVFEEAVTFATDALDPDTSQSLGRLLYIVHLAVILWWLLDKSPGQRATAGLISLLERLLPIAAVALRLSRTRRLVVAADALCREALFGEPGGLEPHA
jgi:AcrR family transcriptional regulator